MPLLTDLRHALRSLARAPLTTAVLLLSLALGTGANATLFSVMDGVLFRPPPGVADADRLAWVFTSQFTGAPRGLTSYPDYLSIRDGGAAFTSLAAFDDSAVATVGLGDSMQRVRIVAVSPEFFSTLGMQLQAGSFTPAVASAPAPPAVISDTLWTMFGRPADAVGRELRIGDVAYAIAGVAPAGFTGLQTGRASDVWIPLTLPAGDGSRGDRRLSVLGRLRDGLAVADAENEVRAAGERLAARYPETNQGTRTDPDQPRVMSAAAFSRLDAAARSQVLLIGTVVLGSTGLLLLSACVNAGSLLLSKSAARRRELAVKLALGASRATLIRQVLFESAVVSVGGAALGLLFARWTAGALPAFFAPEEAAMLDTRLDAGTVAVTAVLSCLAGAVFALGPARHALQKVDILVLRGDAGAISERTGSRFRGLVVVFQVALSTLLLIVSGVMVRALGVALEGDLGRGGRGVVVTLVRMPGALEGDIVRGIRFHRDVADAALRLPGAEAAGWVSGLPVGRRTTQGFGIQVRPELIERLEVETNVATTGYFQALRIALVEGRLFTSDDGALDPPVIVVNDILADRYFGARAVGQRLQDANGVAHEIVGVVRSGKYRTLQEALEPMVYFSLSQRDQEYLHLVVRTAGSDETAAAAMPVMLSSIDRGVSIYWTTTFAAHVAAALTLDRILTTVVTVCAGAALVLATMGVYGVIGDAVRRRTPEIGLRVALGAPNLRILQLVFAEGVPLSSAGAAVGIAAALIVSRVIRMVVHDLPSVDLASLAVVPVALLVVVAGAAVLPVLRALRVSPTIALRAQE